LDNIVQLRKIDVNCENVIIIFLQMNYNKIYDYRFRGINHSKKTLVWDELSKWLFNKYLNRPKKILDPAGGMCEFINSVPAKEKWAIDMEEAFIKKYAAEDIKIVIGSNLKVEIPQNYFDGIFVSNFLEHLKDQEEVALFLERMYNSLKQGGRIAIMGPNFKHCYREYFDFADHHVILTELSVAEHLYGAGFEIVKTIPRFFPLSFRSGGHLPITSSIIKAYIHFPFAWKIMGKQFLIIGEKQ
jgi:hypothetical protein